MLPLLFTILGTEPGAFALNHIPGPLILLWDMVSLSCARRAGTYNLLSQPLKSFNSQSDIKSKYYYYSSFIDGEIEAREYNFHSW